MFFVEMTLKKRSFFYFLSFVNIFGLETFPSISYNAKDYAPSNR